MIEIRGKECIELLSDNNGYAFFGLHSGHPESDVVRALLLNPVQATQTQGLHLIQHEQEVPSNLLSWGQ